MHVLMLDKWLEWPSELPCPLRWPLIAGLIVSDLSKYQTVLCWHLKSEPCIVNYLVFTQLRQNFVYPKTVCTLYSLYSQVHSRLALNLMSLLKKMMMITMMTFLVPSAMQKIYSLCWGKVADNSDVGSDRDQWRQFSWWWQSLQLVPVQAFMLTMEVMVMTILKMLLIGGGW